MNSRPWGWSVCKPVLSFTAHCVQWVGKKIKGCFVSLLKRSQRSKLSFFLFLGGSGSKSESLVLFVQWVLLGAVADIWPSTWTSSALVAMAQASCFWTAPLPRLFSSAKPNSTDLEEIDSLCLWPFNQKRILAEKRQWSKGIGGGGRERRYR